MKSQFTYLVALLILPLIISCEKEEIKKSNEAYILTYDLVGQTVDVEIITVSRSINITFPIEVFSPNQLIANFILSEGATAYVGTALQISGQSVNDYVTSFTYKVVAEDEKSILNWEVSSSNNTYTVPWGLGRFLMQSLSNNRDYEWYLDQANTGTYSNVNCGPTSTTMAAKWSDPSFSNTPEDARAAYRPDGGWWYTSDIGNYLTDHSIPHLYIALAGNASGTQQVISSNLNDDKILILCLDMYYIRDGTANEWRIDKFYTTGSSGWGHFIVVKGYRNVDGEVFFEVYDPNCYGMKYNDETFKGKNRYYRDEDIYDATSIWWNYAIVISETGAKFGNEPSLDPSEIPHMWGR